MPDGGLFKRTPGAPLSEAELRQRREAARARWAAAGAVVAGAAAAGGVAHVVAGRVAAQQARDRRRKAWDDIRQAKRETVEAEVKRSDRFMARTKELHEAGKKRISRGWPVPLHRAVKEHDARTALRGIRRLPSEVAAIDSEGKPIYAPIDQEKASALRAAAEGARAEAEGLKDAVPPRRIDRKASDAKPPKAHERTIKVRAAAGVAHEKASARLAAAEQIVADMRAGGIDDFDPSLQQAEQAVHRAQNAVDRTARPVTRKTVQVGANREPEDLNRTITRRGAKVRIQGTPDDKGLKGLRDGMKRRLTDWARDREFREYQRHKVALPQAEAAARARIATALTRLPPHKGRAAATGLAALLGGAFGVSAAYLATRPSRMEKLAKAFEETKHRRDGQGRFAAKGPQAMVLVGPPAAGKSTWRQDYLARTTRPTTVVSMDDAIADMASARGIPLRDAYRADKATMKEVERGARARWREAMERGDDVILDRTNARAKARDRWLRSVPAHYRKVAVVFDTPAEELARRRAARPAAFLPGHWQTPEEIEAGLQPPQRGEFHRVRRVVFQREKLAKHSGQFAELRKFASDPTQDLLSAGDAAESAIGERLAAAFREWRDAPASELLDTGADLVAQIQRGFQHATAPIVQAMNRGADATPNASGVEPGEAKTLVFSFDARNPRVERYIREYREQKVRELTAEQVATIRQTILNGAMAGTSPDEMARQVRQSIGLTASQAAQVAAFRVQLQTMDPRALGRSLRDKRFDRTVQRAIDTGVPMSDDQVNKMVDAYHRRYLAYRATMIARTEGVGAANNGHVAAMQEWLAENPNYTVIKTWIATKDERTRPDHVKLHGQSVSGMDTAFRCDNGDTIRWPGDQQAPARQTIHCFPADTLVQGSVLAATRVKYVGPMLEVSTRSGAKLTITPNHPVLTPDGFTPAGALREGDYVLRYGADGDPALTAAALSPAVAHDPDQAPTRIEDVFCALARESAPVSVQLAVDDLYGDMRFGQGEIEVVAIQRELLLHLQPQHAQSGGEVVLHGAAVGQANEPGERSGNLTLGRVNATPASGVGRSGLSPDGLGVALHDAPLRALRVGPAAEIDVRRKEAPDEQRSADAELARELVDAGSSTVSLDQIIEIRQFNFAGHVYDLETTTGWMVAESIVTSNCRCTLSTRIVPRVQPLNIDGGDNA